MRMVAAAIVEVIDTLEAAGVRAGITGGWGIDALLGRETRPHGDVDLGVGRDDAATAIEALARIGYAIDVDERPARIELAGQRGRVDLHPIEWGPDGVGRQAGFDGEVFDYPPGSLDAVGVIAGREVRCGTPELQVAFHRRYPPRDHDRRDMRALADAYGLDLPGAYQQG